MTREEAARRIANAMWHKVFPEVNPVEVAEWLLALTAPPVAIVDAAARGTGTRAKGDL